MNNLGPKTHVAQFKRSITPPNIDIPTDESANSMDVWSPIDDLASVWKKRKKEDALTCRKEYWGSYAEKASSIPFRLLEAFLLHNNNPSKLAIDLGCGNGDLTMLLLNNGWSVTAVDYSPKALEILSKTNPSEIKSGHLKIIKSSLTKFIPENPVDLVICRNVLSYINPGKFQALWKRIHNLFLKDNGHLIGTLFTKSSHPSQIKPIQSLEDIGAWLLPDFRMARPLLTHAGYTVKNCALQLNTPDLQPEDQIIIQFSAQKNLI